MSADFDSGRTESPLSTPTERYAVLSPCGWGNLGDAAIIDSLLHALHERHPASLIVGYTLHWQDTCARHHIEAHPLTGFSLPYYPLLDAGADGSYTLPHFDGSDVPEGASDSNNRPSVQRFVRRHRAAVSSLSFLLGTVRARNERGRLRELVAELEGTTAVVVAGGGQLDALFGGFFGQPYVLWRWAYLARRVGARFVVLSVGTGTLGLAERWLTCRALRRADYRSYRDPTSRQMLRDPSLTINDPIVPDLAYALPFEPVDRPENASMVIGVSPMNFQHPDYYPGGDLARYERHLSVFHAACIKLLRLGHDVVLFTTDASDDVGLADLTRMLKDAPAELSGKWTIAGARTVPELMGMYQSVDVVVAARLHGVLLAHVAHKPVLALAHERKVRTLMNDLGHERFCLEFSEIDESDLEQRIEDIIEQRKELAADIAAQVASLRARVERQYDAVFGPTSVLESGAQI